MRQCPTLAGEDERPLIAHSIAIGTCQERQRDHYHKCHRCVFRGRPADFVFEPAHRNGTATSRPVLAHDRTADPHARQETERGTDRGTDRGAERASDQGTGRGTGAGG